MANPRWDADRLWNTIRQQGREEYLRRLYGGEAEIRENLKAYLPLIDDLGPGPVHMFSAPGRTELGGNHTDHNHGRVLCAAVRQDCKAAARPCNDNRVRLISAGYAQPFEVDITDLEPRPAETGTSAALIRGILKGFTDAGAVIGGFEARVASAVPVGSGLSSSAAFEVLVGMILNDFYNDNALPPERIARIGQFAENEYFGKPCGLMDQTASAVGGVLLIDFADPAAPAINRVDYDFGRSDYTLAIINTGDSHDDLTAAYAAIPAEMKQVAANQGQPVLRKITAEQIYSNFAAIRVACGDRAILRALHFFSENQRVTAMSDQLAKGDFAAYLELVDASGLSSQALLQNTVPPGTDGRQQAVNLALGLSRIFFSRTGRGTSRVHGGGFAGTVQSYVHRDDFNEYRCLIESTIGPAALVALHIRPEGAEKVIEL